jgi:lysine 2,3-aminomutase
MTSVLPYYNFSVKGFKENRELFSPTPAARRSRLRSSIGQIANAITHHPHLHEDAQNMVEQSIQSVRR